MWKKAYKWISIIFVFSLFLIIEEATAEETNDYIFSEILYENFDKVENAFWDETIFWANNGNITNNYNEVIEGIKSLKYIPSATIGDWSTLGGTSEKELLVQDGVYRVSFQLKTNDVDIIVFKILDSNDTTYYELILNSLTGERVDEIGHIIEPYENENIIYDENTGIIDISLTFDSYKQMNSYFTFVSKTSGNEPKVIIDNFKIEKKVRDIDYRIISEDNFNNSEGEIHTSSLFWVNDSEGTTAEFTNITDEAIDGKSLKYSIAKNGWDILGGSQGDKLNMSGGEKYRISFDLRLINTSYFTMKIYSISTPEMVLYDMYLNDNGKRMPGSTRIENEESIIEQDGVISVSFTFYSDMTYNSYIYLNALGNGNNASVILDNVKIEQEIVDIPYITYDKYFSQGFENINEDEILTDTGFLAGANLSNASLVTDNNVISGDKSLKLEPQNYMSWNEFIKTDVNNVEIKNDRYKVHFKMKINNIAQINIQVNDETNNDILHEFIFEVESLRRIDGIGDSYLDSGKISKFNDTYIGYFELPTLNEDALYSVSILGFSLINDSYIILDDFNILKKLPAQEIDESYYTPPGEITPPDEVLPNGLGGNIETIINKIDIPGIILTTVVGLILICLGYIFIRFIIKKNEYNKKIKIALSLTTSIVIIGVLFATGYLTIDPKLEIQDVIMVDDDNYEDYNYVYPEKISGHLSNPGMGWVSLEEPTYGGHPDLGASGNLPEVDNISLSTSWARIEVVEGVYDFTLIDKVVDYYTNLGKRINLRICTDSLMLPNTYEGAPNWLIEKYNIPYQVVNYTDGGPVRTFKSIDLRDPNYLYHLELFLNTLAEKFKDNPYVDVVEIRGFGNWGEWHSGYAFDSTENRMNTLANIIDKYYDAFAKYGKLLVLSAAWDPYLMPYESYEQYVQSSAFDYLMTLPNATFRRDSGGNLLNYETDERLLSDFFRSGKRLPLLGEFASGIQTALDETYGFDLIGGIDDILFKMRPNYSTVLGWVNMNAAWLIENGYGEIFERGNEMLGYRLAVDMARYPKEVAPGDTFNLLTTFSNSAVGRFWYKYPLRIDLLDNYNNVVATTINNDFDARTFILGEINNVYSTIQIPECLSEGEYKISISIVDEDENPAIKLGMAGEIDNSKRYVLGEIKINKNAKDISELTYKTDYSKINKYNFAPNSTYMVTFKYQPGYDLRNYKFGNYDGYTFALTSEKGGESATVGYYKWQDVSGEPGYKTLIFTTQNFDDYQLNINSEGYGPIDVTDINIEKIGGYYEHFEGYDFTDENSIYLPINIQNTYLSTNKEEVITGNTSVVIDTKAKGDVDALKIDTNVFNLKPNTTYTISFKFKNLSLVGKGGYMYLNLEDEVNNISSRIGEWYERADTPFTTKTFSFTTSDSHKQTIAFGMHNGGRYAIDDIILTEYADGKIVIGEDIESPINEKPEVDLGGIGVLEGFESSSFNNNSFDWGYFGWGQFTYNPNYVISGNSSLMGSIEEAALDNEWFEFASTKLDVYKFKPNTTYTLEFKYRILENPVNDGRFYTLFRSKTLGISYDVGYTALPVLNASDLGKIYTFKQDITIGNAEDYQLIFGMHWLGKIVIDDVLITEK